MENRAYPRKIRAAPMMHPVGVAGEKLASPTGPVRATVKALTKRKN
jgi:hypothetical protein